MKDPHALTIAALGSREIVMTRVFNAPRHLVFDAYTKPELLKRWLGVRGGWILRDCEVDLRVGGAYRWVWWKQSAGIAMGVGGVYREVAAPDRLVCTERFDDAWYPGESLLTTEFLEQDGATALKVTMLYESTEARDCVLRSPMERGVAESYNMLDELLQEQV